MPCGYSFGLIALVAVITFAGCATSGGGSGTPPTPDKQAEQLAADLNAIKAGSATAEGATVRITGEVYLKTGLTVPVGVTLDLTADKVKFELQNGAELTVDGTVNTSGHGDHGSDWVAGGLRIGEGTAVINGSGTINLKSQGCVLNISSKKHLTLEGVTLVGIKDNDRSLVEVSGGGEFVMKSGAITGNTYIAPQESDGGGGVKVNDGTFTMEGGEISGNSVTGDRNAGGGVRIGSDASFTMKGGKISGNSVNSSRYAAGGGVAVYGAGSAFTMEGGEISGNSAASKELGDGGGVNVQSGAFTMSGGIISGNNVSGSSAHGGGVASGDIFIMQGGTISGNSVIGGSNSLGGGVYLAHSRNGVGAFTMLGGTIYGNASAANAGGNANEVRDGNGAPVTGRGAAISLTTHSEDRLVIVVKWGTGGTYTKGGVAQTGGSVIGASSDDTLIAEPAP
ncbi:hypothetical protein FACS1894110_16120 [Spirochaetia bacterium]|nr:hypothetical protein FACS1894110_16120 [Spirochaetia bacterium]